MKWYYNMKISTKLILGFIIVAILAGCIGIVGIFSLQSISNNAQNNFTNYGNSQGDLGYIAEAFQQTRAAVKDLIIDTDTANNKQYLDKIAADDATIVRHLAKFKKSEKTPEELANYAKLESAINNYIAPRDKVIALAVANKKAEAYALSKKETRALTTIAIQAIDENMKQNIDIGNKQIKDAQNSSNRTILILFIIVIISIIASVLLGVFISNIIGKPIKKLLEVADKISEGDLGSDININTKDEVGNLAQSFRKMVAAIKLLTDDANMLSNAAIEGKFNTRADADKHQGDFKKVVDGVNSTLDTVVDKVIWYQSIIDAVPYPMHVTDDNMNWTYMNKGFEKLMIDQGVIKDRESGYGKQCSNAGANICNTQNCGIKQLLKGNPESYFDWCGMSCKQDTAFLKNRKGENVGFVELVTDLTSIIRVSDYTKSEVERIEGNLKLIANGSVDFNMNLKEADQYTEEVKSQFERINTSFEQVKGAVSELVDDAVMLSSAAVEGKLDTRAEASKHQGDFKRIVEGVNNTLDALVGPLNESRRVLEKIALNDLTMPMTGTYKGMMKDFAEDINSVHGRLISIVKYLSEVAVGDTSGLEGLVKIGKRSENDKIIPAVVKMMETIQNLVKEARMIAGAAAEGNLEIRSDETKFQGGYREILDGFNKALDAVDEPIKEAALVLKEMADGNLCIAMEGNYLGSYKVIKDSVNYTLESFNEVLGNITEASDQVSSGSSQVSDGSQALAEGATEQASSVEELTASITQVAAQTKENAINANQANELALTAKKNAEDGNEHMNGMLNSMKEINESSSNISKIIKVIDDIAFQTNILALNAAVEAARAGQHGKGFAVVAEEVRNLAARSANAAKETTALIEGSIKKVEAGTQIANDTAKALVEIVGGVAKAANLVGDIASASNEQASAIAQINKGIEQVSRVVQTNSATAEEAAAASEELSSQAEILKQMVGKFRLKRSTSSNRYAMGGNEMSQMTLEGKRSKSQGYSEAAATLGSKKSRIALSDNEFGKY